MNPWEIPAEAVIYSRAKPASFSSTSEYARNTSAKCISLSKGARQGARATSIDGSDTLWFFEFSRVLVRLDHVARFIINANHGATRSAAMLRIFDCARNYVWPAPRVSLRGRTSQTSFRRIAGLDVMVF